MNAPNPENQGLSLETILKMGDDVEELEVQIAKGLETEGKEPVSKEKLRQLARCAWTFLCIRDMVLQHETIRKQERSAAQAKTLGPKSSIVLPHGVRPIR